MMHDLKPCPFCGGAAAFSTISIGNDLETCIVCDVCECVFTITMIDPPRRDLADVWNRRNENDGV